MNGYGWVLQQTEGQFFERKSCYDRSEGTPRRRPVRDVAKDVAEALAAMANADGGTVVVGIENDGSVTGMPYVDDPLAVLHRVPHSHVRPPLQPRVSLATIADQPVLIYEVDWSADAHQLADGRYLLRIGDKNVPFPASDIEAIKQGKRRRVTEARYEEFASLDDIDLTLLHDLARRKELPEDPEAVLLHYRLAERRQGRLMLTLAALLLFGKDAGRWHPRCGVDFVKYEGDERRVGAALNIIKRERVEAPLVRLIEQVYRTIQPHVRERQQLVDLFFEERLEYPTFAWQEAIVNAVAHRDYRYEGLSIEVWMFENRIEIRSPGELIEPVTLERLRQRERIHASRNPRIVRVLTDWDYMREQGEGVPRMFEAMEHEGLYPPELRLDAGSIFSVTLKNTPVYSLETMRWLTQFEPLGLTGNQKRLLAFAKEHNNTFTSHAYQKLANVDLYTASRDIKELIRKGVVRLPKKRGRVYKIILSDPEPPEDLKLLLPQLQAQGFIKNSDIQKVLGVAERQAARVARSLVELGWLVQQGTYRNRRYVPGPGTLSDRWLLNQTN